MLWAIYFGESGEIPDPNPADDGMCGHFPKDFFL